MYLQVVAQSCADFKKSALITAIALIGSKIRADLDPYTLLVRRKVQKIQF